jgi:long-chain fatty acid transport protein
MSRSIAKRWVFNSVLLLHSTTAFAGSGFELRSQSAVVSGSAQAGMTAGAADLTTAIYNPASLSLGSGTDAAVVFTGLSTSARFSGSAGTILGTAINGNQGGNAGTRAGIPNLYFATGLTDSLRIGLAIAPRFGLGSYWSDEWIGRYYSFSGNLTTLDFIPTVSFRVNSSLSLGLAADVEYARIKVANAIDFGTVGQVLFGGALGGSPSLNDGVVHASADSWGVGIAAGILYEPLKGTRIGFDYHSQVKQALRGNALFENGGIVGSSIAAVGGAFTDTGMNSSLALPASAAVGIYQEIDPRWAVMADAKWTGWHVVKSLGLTFDNVTQPPVDSLLDWRDSWFFALGSRYQITDAIALRAGVAYDQTPTRDATRLPLIPDSDSYWMAIGLGYRSGQNTIDLSYGHVFAKDASIGLSALGLGNTFRGNLTGRIMDSSVDYLSVAFTHAF